MGNAEKERAEFSLRLQQTLSAAGWTKFSPTRLAEEFNRLAGDNKVTVHAVRKWIVGEAIPAQSKLVLLANLLLVSADWLRFGTEQQPSEPTRFDNEDSMLLADISRLGVAQKKVLGEMMRMLIRVGSR